MSRQSSDMPADEVERATRPRKRRHGQFELWLEYKRSPGKQFRWRRYETREIAEKNLVKMQREYGGFAIITLREAEA